MADAPEMLVVDPDAPTDQSAKRSIMSVPTWEEWLKSNGFNYVEEQRSGFKYWKRSWLGQGRGWHIRVFVGDSPLYVGVYNNPHKNMAQRSMVAFVAETNLISVLQHVIAEIEREVSDATKKRRIKDYISKLPVEKQRGVEEAGPIKRPVPDDPAELDKSQLDQLLDRVIAHCFPKGQRVRVKKPTHSRLNGMTGTVVDAGQLSCYVALDDYVNAGDDDPFRFMREELETINESDEDLDAPQPYMAALDYVLTLKQAGYKPCPARVGAKGFSKFISGPAGELDLRVYVLPKSPMSAVISVDYKQGGEGDHIIDSVVDAIDVSDRVRELEELFLQSPSVVKYVDKLHGKNYPNSYLCNHRDHLIYLFGESMLTPDDPDDPKPYLDALNRHADVINAFRAHGVRLGRRMTADNPRYRLFYIPSAVTEVSYDIFLTPQGDDSWEVTAEGNKEFQDQRGQDFQQEFDIDSNWTIPAGIAGDELNGVIDDILADLRRNGGPDEPTIEGPNVDDIDENIDDPPLESGKLAQERSEFLAQEGYVYKADYKGNPHWEKKWKLPLPIKTGKHTLTDLMICPGHGRIWYALVDASGTPKGGYSVKTPSGIDYLTTLRRALLKMRHVAERMPVDGNFNDMFTFLRIAFGKVEDEVDRESRTVEESVADPDDAELFMKRTRMPKLGELVVSTCPKCGDRRELLKNWPDDSKGWGTVCSKCDSFIPVPMVVTDSVADPDAMDPEKYANATLNVEELLTAMGYRHDKLGPVEHWVKYVTPELMFVIFYESGVKWNFQVWMPTQVPSYQWRLKASSPGREIRTMKADLDKWETEAQRGTLLIGVNESEDVNAEDFLRTTYNPDEFLKSLEWVPVDTYHVKTFPTPIEYHMGNMVFTGVQVRISNELTLFNSVRVSVIFVGRDGTGFGIGGYELQPQQLFDWPDDYSPDKNFDSNMPLRRFATGVPDVMQSVKWPEAKNAAVLADSQIRLVMSTFVKSLNKMAAEPLHPAQNHPALEESTDPDDPAGMLQSHPGFHFQVSSFEGEKVYVKEPGKAEDDVPDWPQSIGNVVQGPGDRWYVTHVQGIQQYDLCDYGLGTRKTLKLKTFDTKEQAALAIWLLRQQMIETDGVLGKKRRMPRK